jgi:APA family basic amino acid/polyamine antiporter
MSDQKSGAPRASLSVTDGALMMVGIIIGIGIFKTPQIVAFNVPSDAWFIAVWVLGGVATLIGALVYAELAAAYPSTGGEYTFLTRAYGQQVGFLFAWARTTVIQTGAIAAVCFVLGDYAQQIYSLGTYGAAIYGAAGLFILTLVNLAGTYESKTAQNVLTVLEATALAAIALVGFLYGGGAAPASATGDLSFGALGLAMVLILLTYGGWNEAAYLSADLKNVKRDMIRILLIGTAVVTVLYVAINMAYLAVLGLEGIRKSDAVAAAVMRSAFGASGAIALSVIVVCAALSTINASIFTGARVYHALGQDLQLERLRIWNVDGNNPRNAIIVQSLIAFVLIVFGALSQDGFLGMVLYTSPVFWFFILLVGLSLFVLRAKDPRRERPFRVPLYPVTPILFCLICGYLLYSSLVYAASKDTNIFGWIGIAVLLAGIPLLGLVRKKRRVAAAN